ncbi:MAG: sensor domain-containing diguanylate cyclase [Cellulomonas sp.]
MNSEFYRGVLDRVSDGVYFVTRDRRITYWNAGAERITGYAAAEVVGRNCSDGTLQHVDDTGRQLCLHGCPLAGVMTDGTPREAQIYLHHHDGHRVPVTVRGTAMRNLEGTITGSVEVFSARAANPYADHHRVADDDSLDGVTGLPARRRGELHLQTQLRIAAEQGTSLGLLFIDADRFKAVNDTFGHETGDAVLRMVAQSLTNGLRGGDVPMRWGGEEFLALLPGVDQAGLEATAERVRMLVENSWIQRGDRQARVSVSVGATLALPGETAEDVVGRADRFMYASKHAGRNRVTTDSGVLADRGHVTGG